MRGTASALLSAFFAFGVVDRVCAQNFPAQKIPASTGQPSGYGRPLEGGSSPNIFSQSDKNMFDDEGRSYVTTCEMAPFIDFRGRVKGFAADVVVSPIESDVMGAIVRSGGKVVDPKKVFPSFDVLGCDPRGQKGVGGLGVGLTKKGAAGLQVEGILMKELGADYKAPSPDSPNSYKVVSVLKHVVVDAPGWGYTSDSRVVVKPSMGEVLRPVIVNGKIESIEIVKEGRGYTQMPQMHIESESGWNAKLLPYLEFIKVDPASAPTEQQLTVIDTTKYKTSIGCNGRDCQLRKLGY